MKKFVFFFYNKQFEKIGKTVPFHIEYWNNQNFDYFEGGPFADRMSGMIIFTADNHTQAKETIKRDPFMIEKLISEYHLKEWMP